MDRKFLWSLHYFFFGLSAVFLLFLLLTLLFGGTGEGATITVDDDGGADYETIQDAIDNATQGDTILVWNGTYYENVVVNKTVSLMGNGSNVTTIDARRMGSAITITADSCYVSGFLVRKDGSDWGDSGISVYSDHNIITDNICLDNNPGIFISFSEFNSISDNTCSSGFIGILIYFSDNCTIEKNNCSRIDGQGIRLEASNNCTIQHNTISGSDYGIRLSYSLSCMIRNNSCSSNNYGIQLTGCGSSNINNNSVTENRVGIHFMWSSHDNTAQFNEIYNNRDIGIEVHENKGNTIQAQFNWWGNATGPYNRSSNPKGTGDIVTVFVHFEPWLDEQGNLIYHPSVEEPNRAPFFFLIATLVGLFAALYMVVRTPPPPPSLTI